MIQNESVEREKEKIPEEKASPISPCPDTYLADVSREHRRTFARGHISAPRPNPKRPRSPMPNSSSLLMKKLFPTITGSSLPTNLLPSNEFKTSTIQMFVSIRQHFMTIREDLEDQEERVVGKKFKRCKDEWKNRLPLPYSLSILPTDPSAPVWNKFYFTMDKSLILPTISFFLAIDIACNTTLLHVVGAFLVFGPPKSVEAAKVQEEEANSDAEEEEEGSHEKNSSTTVDSLNNELHSVSYDVHQSDLAELAPPHRENIVFLRRLFSTPAGVWFYSSLAALDVPLSPSTDTLLQRILRQCCSCLRAIAEEKSIDSSVDVSSVLHGAEGDSKSYKTLADCGEREVRALHTFIVLIGKFFRQANPNLLPL